MLSNKNKVFEARKAAVQIIKQARLVAIIRQEQQADVANVIDCLVTAGVKVLEVTANTPGFEQEISQARQKHPEVLVGAGTIINASLAQRAIAAGAQFIVTPNTCAAVVKLAHAHGLPVLMGALTPTDIANAIDYQADFIKVFPAGSLGIDYFKDLQGPFSNCQLMPVGGVNLANISDWFDAGAAGVGVGNDLTPVVRTETQCQALIAHAKAYLAKLPI
ncbi:MAG: bifunctional 4-hydroxy-2-oxoglutarate aldolase/2-dehydro-3-deoxy-phosphogluconate aldolase [Thalassotalea sp.]